MARGVSLRQLISDVRDELRRANTSAAAPGDTASIRRTINHVYRIIAYNTDWPFLQRRWSPIPLNAGQFHYDFPDGLDPDRVTDARVRWSGDAIKIERGIDLDDHNAYDPEAGERSSPIQKWDTRLVGGRMQIEVWPLPDDTVQSLQFTGIQALPALVNNTDICHLESEIVVLYAAAELLPKDSPDKEIKAELAKELLRVVRLRGNSASGKTYRLGADSEAPARMTRATVRVAG